MAATASPERKSGSGKSQRWALLLCAVALPAIGSGCTDPPPASPVVAEGVLHSVSYILGDGRVGGFTRLPFAQAVPGGNGSWNVDAYGRLTRDFLFVTYPNERELTRHAIPTHCLLHVKFGDAGRPNLDH